MNRPSMFPDSDFSAGVDANSEARSGSASWMEPRSKGFERPPAGKVSLTLQLHPDDYRRLSDSARKAGIPEVDFCALAIHRGVMTLNRLSESINGHKIDS